MSKRAEKAAQKIFGPIDKAVVNLVTKQELIDYQNLRMALKKQYIAGYEQAEKDTIQRIKDLLKLIIAERTELCQEDWNNQQKTRVNIRNDEDGDIIRLLEKLEEE